VAAPGRLELPTCGLLIRSSIRLRYGATRVKWGNPPGGTVLVTPSSRPDPWVMPAAQVGPFEARRAICQGAASEPPPVSSSNGSAGVASGVYHRPSTFRILPAPFSL
jgi:hypothetical protein